MANLFLFGSRKDKNEVNEKDLFSTIIHSGRLPREISEDSALKIPSVRAAIELISNSISQLPIYLYTEDENKSIKQVSDQRVSILNDEANRYETGQYLKKKIVQDFLFYGIAYLYKKDGNLHYLESENVLEVPYSTDGFSPSRKEFVYSGLTTLTFNEDEVLVIDSGTNGVLVDGGKIFSIALEQINYQNALLSNGAVPTGVLKSATRLTEIAINRLRASFDGLYSGAVKSGKTLILEEGLDFQTIAMKPDELGLHEGSKQIISEIARIFNLQESMINSNANKYASLEQNNLQALQSCVGPIITAIESSINKHLLASDEKLLGYFFRFDTSELLRTTEKEKVELVSLSLEKGLISFNEARHKLDLPPQEMDHYRFNLGSAIQHSDGTWTIPNMGIVSNKTILEGEQLNENGVTDNGPNVIEI